ncbi:hypothetical protein TWF281_001634 [Arthrobotrys megalospora]
MEPSPPEAPNPIETQPTFPEVVPGGGPHHEQPGLEVVNPVYQPPAYGPESQYSGVKSSNSVEYEDRSARGKRVICGIKRWVFFAILGAVGVAVIVGGVVGGVLGSKGSDDSPSPSPMETTTPINIAAVRGGQNDVGTTVIRQDNTTQRFYIHSMVDNQWRDPITIEGLDPPPSKNTSFAALQAPNSSTIQIFYTAENNTMYDASGTADDESWRMGRLASDTRYGVLVSPNSGFAATPWVVENNDREYSFRVYYIDRTTQFVQELAYDSRGSWAGTTVRFSRASDRGKVALAWVRASNFSYTENQVLHVFYQDQRANLVHVPGYDGEWDFAENSETLGTLVEGTYLAANIMQDTVATNNTVRIMWVSPANRLTLLRGKGASPKVVRGFQPRGTFTNPIDAVGLPESRNVAIAAVRGGSIASVPVGEELRVYYQSLQTPQSIVEIGWNRQSWYTVGLVA